MRHGCSNCAHGCSSCVVVLVVVKRVKVRGFLWLLYSTHFAQVHTSIPSIACFQSIDIQALQYQVIIQAGIVPANVVIRAIRLQRNKHINDGSKYHALTSLLQVLLAHSMGAILHSSCTQTTVKNGCLLDLGWDIKYTECCRTQRFAAIPIPCPCSS